MVLWLLFITIKICRKHVFKYSLMFLLYFKVIVLNYSTHISFLETVKIQMFASGARKLTG
jgi:hypothetical protein